MSPSAAQMKASERSQVQQMINGVSVEIDYSRPSVRGRMPAFGGIEPWGVVWTPGADGSTTFKFSKDVKLNGADVEAGKYSIWFELKEEGPWTLMLHPDTTLFHVPYPTLDGAYLTVDIDPETAPSFVETLRFDIENVRVNGADIQFRWADTLVPIRLDIDPGYDMVFDAAEVGPYTGNWKLDTSMARPADSLITMWRQDVPEDQIEGFDKWLASFDADQDLRLVFEPESGHLQGFNATMADYDDEDPNQPSFVLIRRSEGIFVEGILVDGELMFVLDYYMWEFDFDESGLAISFTQRATQNDEVMGSAERVDSK
ncbi:MAG: DUF2911 domain-containing protein [Bacteroidetes bacterium]|nr:DUF2911 domain-containing protein [Bacteroidota bacterium]